MRCNLIYWLVPLLALMGCSESQADDELHAVVADTIAAPILEIGEGDELMKPVAATRLNGAIVVLDAYAQAVHFFDMNKRLVRSVGRKGSGPGEFQDPAWLGRCDADSLFVFDPMLGRITVMDTAGAVVRQFIAPRASRMSCGDGLIAAIMMPDEAVRRPDPKGERYRFTSRIETFDTEGESKASSGKVPLGEFGPLAKVSAIALTDDRIWFGSADSAYLELYTRKARHAATVPLHLPARKTTDAHRRADIEEQLDGFTDNATLTRSREWLEKFEMPEHLPAYRQIVPDHEGNIWVVTTLPGDTTTALRVIGPDRKVRADITLSTRIDVFEIGADYVLGGYEADGQPRVIMYPLDRAVLGRIQ